MKDLNTEIRVLIKKKKLKLEDIVPGRILKGYFCDLDLMYYMQPLILELFEDYVRRHPDFEKRDG